MTTYAIDDAAADEAQAMADEKPTERHRCPWPSYYGCHTCMHRSDDEEET